MQARLQARHGARLDDGGWQTLEAARSLEQYLERARTTSLRRFAGPLQGSMPVHVKERGLRAEWRAYVAEVADWVPKRWRPAVLWAAHLPDLPILDALRRGERPAWVADEPAFAPLVEPDPQTRARLLADHPLAPLFPEMQPQEDTEDEEHEEAPLPERWNTHWQSLWPTGREATVRPLGELAEAVRDHVARLRRAPSSETSLPHRRDLARIAARLLRRHGGSPVAAFAHLCLVALDLERLRGGMIRRQLFAPTASGGAA